MSGIAKPFIHSTTAANADDHFNVEEIVGSGKVDLPAIGGNAAKYLIVFQMNNGMTKYLRYNTALARNNAYTALRALASANI
jgi:hypothetical protein